MELQSSSSNVLAASASSQETLDEMAPLESYPEDDLNQEPQDATPRRNQQPPRGNPPQQRVADLKVWT